MAESMKGLKRTCRCGEVTKEQIGSTVTLMGWVQKARNKGGIVFVDLRDRSGIIQVIFENGEVSDEVFEKAGRLRSEFVIAVTGTVELRSGAVNENLKTGEIEIRANSLRILDRGEQQDERGAETEVPLSGPAPSGHPAQSDHALSGGDAHEKVYGGRGIP